MTIREIFKEHKVEYLEVGQHHHAREGWLQIRSCPSCGSQNYHLGYNLKGNYFVCWRCGPAYGPKVFHLLRIPSSTYRKFYPQVKEAFKEVRRSKLVEPSEKWPLKDCPLHCRYLLGRGFKPSAISQYWGVEAITLAAQLSWRLYIPVLQRGVRVSWTTRAIGDKVTQRYISAPKANEVEKIKSTVYGADFCSHTIVVCEGPIDAWAIGPGAGALFGTAFTNAQVKRISEFPYRFVCFDSSRAAQVHAEKLCKLLSVFPGVTQNVILNAKDPAEASPSELRKLRKAAGIA